MWFLLGTQKDQRWAMIFIHDFVAKYHEAWKNGLAKGLLDEEIKSAFVSAHEGSASSKDVAFVHDLMNQLKDKPVRGPRITETMPPPPSMEVIRSSRSKKSSIAMMLKSVGPNRFDPESEEEGEEEVERESIAKRMPPPPKIEGIRSSRSKKRSSAMMLKPVGPNRFDPESEGKKEFDVKDAPAIKTMPPLKKQVVTSSRLSKDALARMLKNFEPDSIDSGSEGEEE